MSKLQDFFNSIISINETNSKDFKTYKFCNQVGLIDAQLVVSKNITRNYLRNHPTGDYAKRFNHCLEVVKNANWIINEFGIDQYLMGRG